MDRWIEGYVNGFFMDGTEVTNAQCRAFVDATGYMTTAEKPVDWDELKKQLPPNTPKPPAEQLVPGSLILTFLATAVPLPDMLRWWA